MLTVLPHQHYVAFESYGVRVGVTTNDTRVVDRIRLLPPAESRVIELDAVEHHVTVTTKDGLRFESQYELRGEAAKEIEHDMWIGGDADFELAVAHLEAHVHECVALNAPHHLFLRGASVLHQGRTIVVLGEGLTGRTTLVAALVRAGATYYSDDYVVLDEQGGVHRYTPGAVASAASSAMNGGSATPATDGTPAHVGAAVVTRYRPGVEWAPRRLSRGEGMMTLLSYAVPVEDRADDAMKGIARMLDSQPVVLSGERGEADLVAPLLLADAELESSGTA